jgi:membrane protein DedA with SNARE-associated domain
VQAITDFFERFIEQVPLELFVLIGIFLEELFSPIPSFAVLVPAGVAAEAQGLSAWYLLVLMLFSAFGRIAAAVILYWLADKFEDKVLSGDRRFLGVSHKEIEHFGQRLGKKGKRDGILLFLMNATPIFPTGALSVMCGFLKVRFRMFLICTFFGTMLNSLFYMLLGYFGFKATTTLRGLEIAGQVLLGVLLLVVIIWAVRKKKIRNRA